MQIEGSHDSDEARATKRKESDDEEEDHVNQTRFASKGKGNHESNKVGAGG